MDDMPGLWIKISAGSSSEFNDVVLVVLKRTGCVWRVEIGKEIMYVGWTVRADYVRLDHLRS